MLTITHATVSLDDVQGPAKNPNHMTPEDFEALRAGIREFGPGLQPPLLRRLHPPGSGPHEGPTWEAVDGDHRVRALREEGFTEMQAVCTDADERTARILQVAMNKVRGELNLTAVAETVRELVDAKVDLETIKLIGYADDELKAMLEATAVDTAEDVLGTGTGDIFEEDDEKPAPKPFLLELTFSTAAELRKVKRVLKKAGSGDHAAGLLSLIDGA
jgi:ParB-like chromosome segregation protein Spo0J